jgi:succinate-acetate transporter protein
MAALLIRGAMYTATMLSVKLSPNRALYFLLSLPTTLFFLLIIGNTMAAGEKTVERTKDSSADSARKLMVTE